MRKNLSFKGETQISKLSTIKDIFYNFLQLITSFEFDYSL